MRSVIRDARRQMAIKRKRRRQSQGKQCGKSWKQWASKQANSKGKQGKASKPSSQQACMSSVALAPSLTSETPASRTHFHFEAAIPVGWMPRMLLRRVECHTQAAEAKSAQRG